MSNDLHPQTREQVLALFKLMKEDVLFGATDALWRHYQQLGQVLEQEQPCVAEKQKIDPETLAAWQRKRYGE